MKRSSGRRHAAGLIVTLGAWLISSFAPGPARAQEAGKLEADVVSILGSPAGAKPAGAAIDAGAADIAAKLRCPVCQGVSIADSPSGMATKMRGQVRDLVAAGYSEEQVMNYFEHSYGEFVRLEPPMRGLNWMLWLMPAIVLMAGATFVIMRARRPALYASALTRPVAEGTAAHIQTGAASENPATAKVDPELAKYLERIRRDSGTSS